MSKKKQRKTRTSKGIHGTSARAKLSSGMDRLLNQYDAHEKGKNVRVNVGLNKPRRNSKDIWPDPKKQYD